MSKRKIFTYADAGVGKPLHFEDEHKCNAQEDLKVLGEAKINAALASAASYEPEYCNAGPTPGIPYPELRETNGFDVERTQIRCIHLTDIVRWGCITAMFIYFIHSGLLWHFISWANVK